MIVRRLTVTGLTGSDQTVSVDLFDDLNILTGKNGSGKTTALKLIWYIISGNIGHAINEIPFTKVEIETSEYKISITKNGRTLQRIELTLSEGEGQFNLTFEYIYDDDGDLVNEPIEEANSAIREVGSSVFFPTFRRIEGGFSIRSTTGRPPNFLQGRVVAGRSQSALEDAMQELSRRLTVGSHTFVASISTVDIVQLLMRQYTDMSERSNTLQQKTSQEIIEQIKDFKLEKGIIGSTESADTILDSIKATIEKLDVQREEILAPLTAVRKLTERLLQHAGITLGGRLTFGDAARAVSSELLSAGEKQMLSFICYNAFTRNSVIFIDEPELSLHVDWQRQLFSIMQNQGTFNQFIIATHSPFIYGKFPDKEIAVNSDRGDLFSDLDE